MEKIMKKKLLVVLLTTMTAGSMLQARHTDSEGIEHRGWVEGTFELPFELAALPFDQGYYSERHQRETDAIRAKNKNKKYSNQSTRSKRKRTRPVQEQS